VLYEIKWKTNQKIRNKKYETVGIVPKIQNKMDSVNIQNNT
jgi:hypothetical protein